MFLEVDALLDQVAVLGQFADELLRDLNLEGQVTFTGDTLEVRTVLPEPFGRAVMESMAAETPGIGSRCGGIPEQILDGITGFLFAPGDENDLARVLARLMADDALRRRFGQASRLRFRESFGIHESHANLLPSSKEDDLPNEDISVCIGVRLPYFGKALKLESPIIGSSVTCSSKRQYLSANCLGLAVNFS